MSRASAPTGSSSRAASEVDESSEVSDLNFLLNGGTQSNRVERQTKQEHFRKTMPPSGNELRVMAVQQAVDALIEHAENPQVVISCCERWQALGYGPGRRQSAAEAGALAAIVAGMRAHPRNATVQEKASLAIANICSGTDDLGLGRKAEAFDAGAVTAIVDAFAAHPETVAVNATGAAALGNICYATDFLGLKRKHAAYDAGAIPPLCAAMTKFSSDAAMCENGAFALGNLCRALGKVGADDVGVAPIDEQMRLREEGATRKASASEHGALEALIAAMKAHEGSKGIMDWGSRALSIITFESSALRERAKKGGAKMQWLMGLVETMDVAQKSKATPVSKTGRPPMATMAGGGAGANAPNTGRVRAPGSMRRY